MITLTKTAPLDLDGLGINLPVSELLPQRRPVEQSGATEYTSWIRCCLRFARIPNGIDTQSLRRRSLNWRSFSDLRAQGRFIRSWSTH